MSEAALALAERSGLSTKAGSESPANEVSSLRVKVASLFEWVYQRKPDQEEILASEQFASQVSLEALARAMLNANEFMFIE